MGGGAGGGVPCGELLVAFSEAVVAREADSLREIRSRIASELGEAALVDAAAVAALFNAIDRVADSTGIPLEDDKSRASTDFRADLGIDHFKAEAI